MQVKVCGLKYPDNLLDVVDLKPDYIGFIFYENSRRFISKKVNYKILEQIPGSIKRIGVFVNEDIEVLEMIVNLYELDFVQLHGDESPSYCNEVANKGIRVIKAFSIGTKSDFKEVQNYVSASEFFLFDTKGELRGGNGSKFNWELLTEYDLEIPFLLSGGIGLDDIESINKLSHDMLLAVDINSRFELESGVKDIQKLKKFINKVQSIKQMVI
jgi:phosphoribosylanthranilate isomerase